MFYIFIFFFYILLIFELKAEIKINKLEKLNDPWGITFIDKNNLIITEKNGKIKLYNLKKKKNILHST